MLRQRLGLDRPVHEQYITYWAIWCGGDLGESYYFKRPVADALRERFPATAQLALTIFVLAVALGSRWASSRLSAAAERSTGR